RPSAARRARVASRLVSWAAAGEAKAFRRIAYPRPSRTAERARRRVAGTSRPRAVEPTFPPPRAARPDDPVAPRLDRGASAARRRGSPTRRRREGYAERSAMRVLISRRGTRLAEPRAYPHCTRRQA